MGMARWFRPPGRTLAVFLCLMLVLGGALGWLGWQWLKQDRALEGQRRQDRLELAADRMAMALQGDLADLDAYLSSTPGNGAKDPPEGVLSVRATRQAFDAFPAGRLLFYPLIPKAEEPAASAFAAGEALEFRRNDPAGAAAAFRALTRSPDPGLRAGAWLRLGRALRKLGRHEEALLAYDEMARLGRTPVLGLPADLVAQVARGSVLEATGKRDELTKASFAPAIGPLERPLDPARVRPGNSIGGKRRGGSGPDLRPSGNKTRSRWRRPPNRSTASGKASLIREGGGS